MAVRNDQSRNKPDAQVQLLRRLEQLTRHDGKIVKKISQDVYTLDIDSLAKKEVMAYATISGTDYKKDAIVKVSFDYTGVALILPSELPRTPGKYKVVQAIDDSTPPTLDNDYIRFHGSIEGPELPP